MVFAAYLSSIAKGINIVYVYFL